MWAALLGGSTTSKSRPLVRHIIALNFIVLGFSFSVLNSVHVNKPNYQSDMENFKIFTQALFSKNIFYPKALMFLY